MLRRQPFRHILPRLRLWLFAIATLVAFGCAPSSDEGKHEASDQSGSVAISLIQARQVDGGPELSDIACVVLRVTASDLDRPIGATGIRSPGVASIEFTLDVPIGANRLFEAEAFAEEAACDVAAISPSFIPNFIPLFQSDDGIVSDITPTGGTLLITMSPMAGLVVRPPTPPVNTDGTDVSLQIVVRTPGTSPITFSATGLPPGLNIDPATGLIDGSLPRDASVGSPYTVNITASDGADLDSTAFIWTVTNPKPVVSAPEDPFNRDRDTVNLQIVVNDPDRDALTFSATGLPPGLSIDPATGLIAGSLPSNASVGSPYMVNITASDGTDLDSTAVIWTVTNPKPVVTAPEDPSNREGEAVALRIIANDPDGDALMFSAAGLPPGLAINPSSGLISGTLPSTGAAGRFMVTVTVTDGVDSASAEFTWIVSNPNPVITSPGDQSNIEGDAVVLQITANDPDGDTLTFSAAGLPLGLAINPSSGLISGVIAFTASANSPYNVTIEVTDETDTSRVTFSWTVQSAALSIANQTTPENNATGAVFTVRLSVAVNRTITVDFATADSTATAGQDYQASSGRLIFNPGDLTQPITVPILDDTLDESAETFMVNLSNAIGATIADAEGVGTIADDDEPPTLAINDVIVTEGSGVNVPAVFTVTLSAASGQPVTVTATTSDGTATMGADYQATNTLLTFDPGDLTKTLTVPVIGDLIDELTETFAVTLSGVSNAVIADAQGIGTIADNDGPPSLAINDVMVTEGDLTAPQAIFTVTLSAASGQLVTVTATASDNTATVGTDYLATTALLSFDPGVTTREFSVTIVDNTVPEQSESFFVALSGPSNATISDGQGIATITDNDLMVAVSSQDTDEILGYDALTGAFVDALVKDDPNTPEYDESGGLYAPSQLLLGADGRFYVSSMQANEILRYDVLTGAFVDALVKDNPETPEHNESGGLQTPGGMAFGPDGWLYVSSQGTHSILRYDPHQGGVVDTFITDNPDTSELDESGGLQAPGGIAFGPDGWLYVISQGTNAILRYDPQQGGAVDAFITDNPDTPEREASGGLQGPGGIAFGPDGLLYVSSRDTDEILRYNPHTGAFVDTFIPQASGGLDAPGQLVFGPDGVLYVSSLRTHEILRYDRDTGAFLGVYAVIDSGSQGLIRQMSLIFMPQQNGTGPAPSQSQGVGAPQSRASRGGNLPGK